MNSVTKLVKNFSSLMKLHHRRIEEANKLKERYEKSVEIFIDEMKACGIAHKIAA